MKVHEGAVLLVWCVQHLKVNRRIPHKDSVICVDIAGELDCVEARDRTVDLTEAQTFGCDAAH